MKFEFAVYTDVTELAFETKKDYEESGYVKVFLCEDVNDFHIIRILKDTNAEYEREEGVLLVEKDSFSKPRKNDYLNRRVATALLLSDSFEVYESEESHDSLEETIKDYVDGGYGIN